MDCEACTDLQLDLLYQELAEPRAAEAQRHIDDCADCRAAWERLVRGRRLGGRLAPVEAPAPSASLLAAIAAAAEKHRAAPPAPDAGGAGAAPVVPIDAARARPSWMRRLGEMAMRRQVAMAAVSIMAIGIGLRFVPFRSPTQPAPPVESTAPAVIPATELPRAQPPPPAAEDDGSAAAARRGRAAPAYLGSTPVVAARQPSSHAASTSPLAANARLAQGSAPAAAPAAAEESPADERNNAVGGLQLQREVGRGGGAASAGGLGSANLGSAGSAARGRSAVDALRSPVTEGTYEAQQQAPAAANVPMQGRDSAEPDLPRDAPAPLAQGWRAHRDQGEHRRAAGDLQGAITEYQRAIDSAPDSERRALAVTLEGLLRQAGRVDDAMRVRGQYVTRAAESPAQAESVPQSSNVRPTTPTPRSSPARPMAPRPSRRAVTNLNDSTNQYGF
ncbi:MAG: hypothetical protein R3A52_06405 [Polyangiales bacterium]